MRAFFKQKIGDSRHFFLIEEKLELYRETAGHGSPLSNQCTLI